MTPTENKVTLTKRQKEELNRFENNLRNDYETGYYDFDIKRCFEEHSRSWLTTAVLAGAHGWFLKKDIPFACVYELCHNFVKKILQERGYYK